ncbi:ribbon-helix-helix domain-containing protein [Lysinibacillus sp. FSL K6-0057]|uniref:ribbon-helix-helix domain-containing protein n=1 Tax=Lysinibacillus sp. FSL K6-0057 TaxID=2921411 RepID=UPI00315A54B5
MARSDLKTRTPIGSAVKTELLEELRAYSKETDIPISKLLDKAITMLLESTKK